MDKVFRRQKIQNEKTELLFHAIISFWFNPEFHFYIFVKFKFALFVMAIVACAAAIPAGVPQPRPIAPQARQATNPESEQLSSGADDDLKASNSYGYGYYGLGGLGGVGGVGYSGIGYGGYGGYGGGYGYPYSYGGYYPYTGSYYSCKYCICPQVSDVGD